ncbi:MAG: S53 family peptidase [Syntrophobacteraceae bacterium]|nr:S53 family peptidase [Syntrophobacteraceae bacterium]
MIKRALIVAFAVACMAFPPTGAFAVGSKRVVLHGNVNPRANPEFDQGTSDPFLPMNQRILLLKMDPQKQAQLDRLVADQQDSSSANFHKWLTAAQFGQRFGRRPEEIATVTNWLVSQGFTIDSVSKSATMISFSGTAAAINRAFDANMHDYRVNGHLRHANSVDPSIPSALANLVAGPVSLSTFPRKPAHGAGRPLSVGGAKASYTSGGAGNLSPGHYLSPGDFAAVYDVNSVYGMGYTGSGITIAIVGQAPPDTSMWAKFQTTFGVPYKTPTVITAGKDTLTDAGTGDVVESDIDVEWASSVAPAATIDYVTSAISDGGIDTSAQYIVDNNLAPVMSVSYDLCESDLGSSGNQYYSQLWEQAAAEGITVFVASGDSGAYDCVDRSGNPTGTKAVNGMASTPYNVAVGGTSLSDSTNYWSATNSAKDVSALSSIPTIPEVAWNNYSSFDLEGASGGGASTVYAKPSWQVCPGVPNDSRRDLPDVSLNADPNNVGYLVYTCDDNNSPCSPSSYGLWAYGGTSCASPSFAAIMALIEQGLGGARQGNANTVFYRLGSAQYSGTSASDTVFNDITSGTNGFVGSGLNLTGYSCTTGYDRVTGLGSVDATHLLLAYQGLGGLWTGATDVGSGWKFLSWFGYFYTDSYPWIYHQSLGWLYPSGTSAGSIWFWDQAMNDYWWTSQTLFPYIYRAGDNTWLYYQKGSNPPLFYNFTKKSWVNN